MEIKYAHAHVPPTRHHHSEINLTAPEAATFLLGDGYSVSVVASGPWRSTTDDSHDSRNTSKHATHTHTHTHTSQH